LNGDKKKKKQKQEEEEQLQKQHKRSRRCTEKEREREQREKTKERRIEGKMVRGSNKTARCKLQWYCGSTAGASRRVATADKSFVAAGAQ